MSFITEIRNLVADVVPHYQQCADDPAKFTRINLPIRVYHQPLLMTEDGDNATLKTVYVTGLDSTSLVLKPDNFCVRFFRAGTWNKQCDYLILTTINTKDYALFVELKSSLNDEPSKYDHLLILESKEDRRKASQLESSAALFEYLGVVVARKGVDVDFSKVERRKMVLYESIKPRSPISSNVRPVTNVRNKANDIIALQVHDAQTLDISQLIRY